MFISASVDATGQDESGIPEKKFLILPFGFYTTDTSVGIGVFSQYAKDEENKVFGNTVYTFKNQFMLIVSADLKNDCFVFNNFFKIKDYYSEFYGYGNNTDSDDPLKYRFFQLDNTFEFGKMISERIKISAAVNNFLHITDDHKIQLGYDNYGGGNFYNGIGGSAEYKNISGDFFRDGFFMKALFLVYPEIIGNPNQFFVCDFEAGFFKSFNKSAFNTLLSLRSTAGDVHPEKLSRIGGTKVLRGYPDNRFIDYNLAALQTQYDFRIYKDFSGCVFIGCAEVFEMPNDISYLKAAFGAGIMYKYKNLIMRFEAATSPEKNIEIIITGNRVY